ncbi:MULTISPECIES: hypothetical protein [unclassified Rhizobacter]|uniref:hypothetical protein n=1 Tax=unclassified Rhizobacter TaxID=2640088 RepID=UPI000A577A03|nr:MULTISPECIES: hypothetical protein [unclassified Rhizobacter]
MLFCVDFNETLEPDLVLLSATDTKIASDGAMVRLRNGQEVIVFMEDSDEQGQSDNLVASGVVEANQSSG